MSMSIPELERALRALRLSGMTATLQARAQQVAQHEMDFIEAFSWLVQDELDRRRSRLLDRRFTLSGLPERKDLKDFDWSYNPKLPKREVLELATLKFIEEREGALLYRPAGPRQESCCQGARAPGRAARLQGVLPRGTRADRGNQRGTRARRDPQIPRTDEGCGTDGH